MWCFGKHLPAISTPLPELHTAAIPARLPGRHYKPCRCFVGKGRIAGVAQHFGVCIQEEGLRRVVGLHFPEVEAGRAEEEGHGF